MNFFSYYYSILRYPAYRDYIDMGAGIEARYLRCEAFWKRHLEYSKAFQAAALSSWKQGGSLAVLGAGRLLDVDLCLLSERFEEIHLFDADPSVIPYWKRARRSLSKNNRLHFHIGDISASIQSWTEKFKFFLQGNNKVDSQSLKDFLKELNTAPTSGLKFDCIISLNLLSQIGIYWRDRALALLQRYSKDTSELEALLNPTLFNLEQQHLDLLAKSSAKSIVLIYDTEFFYYRKHLSGWQIEAALQHQGDLLLPGFKEVQRDTWLWHLAPQDIEQPDFGSIHRVSAKAFAAA